MTTSRTSFNETWLAEMPVRLGEFGDLFDYISKSVSEWKQSGKSVEKLPNNLFRLQGNMLAYYWLGTKDEMFVVAELEKKAQVYAVTMVGKNPKYKNIGPYAADLYKEIVGNVPLSLLFSDAQISDDGIKLWKRLISDPNYVVSVYNVRNPGASFTQINTPDDIAQYMDNYQLRFILSHAKINLAETRSFFNTRRYRELAGMPNDQD